MTLDTIELVYVNVNYLEYLHNIDNQVQFNKDDPNYNVKPHVGMLISAGGMKYVIPLTSAKEKHRELKNVGATYFKIQELIDITKTHIGEGDIIEEITNMEILNDVPRSERANYKYRLLSILDVRKMIPVKSGVYRNIQFRNSGDTTRDEQLRARLILKERNRIYELKDQILRVANKLYNKQMKTKQPLPYQCDFIKLEKACAEYEI